MFDFLRPELRDQIWRGREVIAAAIVAACGLWLVWLGGLLLVPFGLAVTAVGVVLAVTGLRRMRFHLATLAPGIVELDEGQIGYLGPEVGGFVSLLELVELRLLILRGRRVWRLKQADGQALLIPVDASGAERLFDAFANLPGMDQAALVAAVEAEPLSGSRALTLTAETRVIWRRAAAAGVVAR